MDVVLIMFKGDQQREFPVSGEKTVLGRRLDCQLRIPTKDVSRQHCILLVENEKVVARDLGSSNGTFVNGKRIAEAELKAGDRLRLGPVTFVVKIDGEPADLKPQDVREPVGSRPSLEAEDDEETFDLGEGDFDLDEALSADEDEDDKLP